jgi:hypothetical protein
MRSYGRESLVYTAVFCLGYLVACGSGGGTGGSSSGGNTAGSIREMVSSDLRPVSIVQSSTGVQSAMAAFLPFMGKARRALTITNPSAVGQSYESDCRNFGPVSGPWTSIHAAWGNSGLISMQYAYATFGACGQAQPLSSVGSDENGNPQGYPVVLDGTINTLAVYGTFASGKRFECVDTTNTSPLSDGSFVRAYYDLAHDAIILGSGTNQLAPTCSITIPSGDDVSEIHVQWLKS